MRKNDDYYGRYNDDDRYGQRWNEIDYGGMRRTDVPVEILREHPDARIATTKDGMIVLVVSTLILLVFAAIFGFFVYLAETSRAETERIISCNVTVDGTVTKTWSETHRSRKTTRTNYYASYTYVYEDQMYSGKTSMRAGQLREDQTITVYVDPASPSKSRLFREENITAFLILIMLVPLVVIWIFMLRHFILCAQGRIVTYKYSYSTGSSKGSKTVWRKFR